MKIDDPTIHSTAPNGSWASFKNKYRSLRHSRRLFIDNIETMRGASIIRIITYLVCSAVALPS